MLRKNMKKLHAQLGFTMIELLIVITILGILAVAVLSAINPIEQINRGRDTGRQSDAEQLLSAIDRYNAFQGYYPWQEDADVTDTSVGQDDGLGNLLPIAVTEYEPCVDIDDNSICDETLVAGGDCPIVARLSTGNDTVSTTYCRGAQELKDSFITRITDPDTRSLYVYNSGDPGSSTYVCFVPQSGAFDTQGSERCANDELAGTFGNGLPEDVGAAARVFICDKAQDRDGDDSPDNAHMVCLP
jgi:prepilin-type N-terminal cleavage/methylation domain-containing protein